MTVTLSFFDPRGSAMRDFSPAAPPAVGVAAAGSSPRERAVAEALSRALAFLGFQLVAGREIVVGGEDPGPGRAWLAVAPLSGAETATVARLGERGFSPDDLRFYCGRVHYRSPMAFDWGELDRARAELRRLRDAEIELSRAAGAPNAGALAGYLLRVRSSLARDLDLPGALACVRDGLRPGALSPGSRAALLRAALPALGVSGAAPAPFNPGASGT